MISYAAGILKHYLTLPVLLTAALLGLLCWQLCLRCWTRWSAGPDAPGRGCSGVMWAPIWSGGRAMTAGSRI